MARAAMGKEGDKSSSRDLLLELLHSDMNMARAYAAVARSKYDQGKVEEGDFARLKAVKFYSKARRSAGQMEEDRKPGSSELESLRSEITSLSLRPGDSHPNASAPLKGRFKKGLQRLSGRWRRWRD